ncbi:MAG: O-acetylhomoserine aminocarboxypropyltransferase/cysteine synthase [Deltaproteobacteria bacterium]|jgi:O-acetylhomoserine (thiol)-lyase|nr:O-acetylhomoserine aminocarboxypropyltransferase/cysteine synthase [Deltaproteobacteria bacterium]MBT4265132.1 O-acetylhomoserine aminocarboxypropyltransferase/cysteine synthase [Deltaproteobacteria bacterium]MBT6499484.1 O-acetylhomoserine aminocarboxypropyltransferase/cysteine synthase [Deltaproteobacteria bacterium]MBT6615053.1 O-acetylhomoserine aminocarboxypropyltransferase/cysteine synthase [Deltaproteobacteria bacterium]MBT7154075.1 O-acetylhomoserine aminocarboxypropyltransferase/cys
MREPGFNTKAIHGSTPKPDVHRAIRFPIYSGVAYDFESAENIEGAFTGRIPAHIYSRSSNPTVAAFESKMTSLENGHGTVALSSGMAAISNTLLNLLEKGDNILASNYLFGNTYSLFMHTLPNFGIETRFVDITRPDTIEQALDGRTRLIFFETISNPQMIVPDIVELVDIGKSNNLTVIVDSSVTSPYLFQASEYGADIVIHSTTKFISGGATSVGGAIIDLGNANWSNFPSLQKYHHLKQDAFLARLRKEVYRNFGSCMSPQAAHFQSLGLETLSLRVEKSCANAMTVAKFLEQKQDVTTVFYPGLDSSPFHEIAQKQFNGHFGGILSFELENKETSFKFINALKLIRCATNLNDNVSLIIHPASTIYADFTPEQTSEMGITDKLIRLSVGIEDVEDLLYDIDQALRCVA